ncbi:MAG: DegV family protein [Erysipelotrichaceae bacterium]|nr:DegV family protein [Erysipelotrichaceae bacterium]
MAIRIFTDSTSEISQAQAKKFKINVIPMTVNFGDESFLDGINLFNEDFYKKLRLSNVLPKTSLINSETFIKHFSEISDEDEIIGIFISSELSGSLQSAFVAKESLPNKKIHLIDSKQVTFGLAALVLYAIRLRDEGKTAKEIIDLVEDAKKRLVVVAVIDDLKYLKLGGRLSSASAVLGTIMGVKPLIRIEDGKVLAVHKAFGLIRAYVWLVDQYLSVEVDKTMPRLFGHSDAIETLKDFQKFVSKKTDFPLDTVYPIGVTVGVHAGPGAVGFCYFKKAH